MITKDAADSCPRNATQVYGSGPRKGRASNENAARVSAETTFFVNPNLRQALLDDEVTLLRRHHDVPNPLPTLGNEKALTGFKTHHGPVFIGHLELP